MIRVLIVDDSPVISMLLKAMIDAESDMTVVGMAKDGEEGVRLTAELRPDIITMDIRMPKMDGFEATQKIMMETPTPILVVSASVNNDELRIAFNAIEQGALFVIEKPPGLEGDSYEKVRDQLISHLRALSEIKVIRRRKFKSKSASTEPSRLSIPHYVKAMNEVVVIGASTGGPIVIENILKSLPINFPVPVVIVQHIASGFVGGLATWLNDVTGLKVKLAEANEILLPGIIYIAPSEKHLRILRLSDKRGLIFNLLDEPKDLLFRPSIDILFESVAMTCPGHAIGCLLTGMGDDGARGLHKMYESKCYTFIQDQETSVIFGMPGSAKSLNANLSEVPADMIGRHIADHLLDIADTRKEIRK